jgi:hypothetical protein
MQSFREFVNAGAFQNTGTTGYDNQVFGIGHSLNLPTPTMDMPTKTLQGNVRRIKYNENPISVQLDDGSVWHLTKKQWDYLRVTNKEPQINSNIQIEMYLDGTIKSVTVNQRNFKGKSISERSVGPKQNNLLGGKTNKPEKTFGKRHMPF